jgi:hypothetical protein
MRYGIHFLILPSCQTFFRSFIQSAQQAAHTNASCTKCGPVPSTLTCSYFHMLRTCYQLLMHFRPRRTVSCYQLLMHVRPRRTVQCYQLLIRIFDHAVLFRAINCSCIFDHAVLFRTVSCYQLLMHFRPRRLKVPSVQFMETLHALAGMVAGAELPAEEEQKLHDYFGDSLPKVRAVVAVCLTNGRRWCAVKAA